MKSLLLFLYRKKLSSFWSVKAILVITAEEECGLFGIESTRLIITEYIINNNTEESGIAHNTLNSCTKAKKNNPLRAGQGQGGQNEDGVRT